MKSEGRRQKISIRFIDREVRAVRDEAGGIFWRPFPSTQPGIIRIFKDLEYVERPGSDIPSVVAKHGREIYSFSNSIIRFVILFTQAIEKVGQMKTPQKTSEKILRLIAGNPEISSKEIASILGMIQRENYP
jgi:predicted HTH transcriptional regulator